MMSDYDEPPDIDDMILDAEEFDERKCSVWLDTNLYVSLTTSTRLHFGLSA